MECTTLDSLLQKGLEVVQDAIAVSTKNQYRRCWSEWVRFCTWYTITPLEASSENVLSYLSYVSDKCSSSVSTAYTHLSSIAYHYRINGKPSITESNLVTMYMKGLKGRNLDRPVKQATPMSTAVLSDLRKLLLKDARLMIWRTVWRAHAEFGLLLRFDDIKRLQTTDVTFEENATGKFIRIKLQGGKTTMTSAKKKNDCIITPNGLESCLYSLTQRYITFLGDHQGSLQPNCSPGNSNVPHPSRSIGYTLKMAIDAAGHDGSKYTEHSNKRGGATHAANSGLSSDVIKDIGNWKSLKTAKLYIDESTPLRQKRNLKLQTFIVTELQV